MESILDVTYRHLHPEAGEAELRIRVGRPYADPDGDWTCDVSFEGSIAREHAVHGIDALQAFCLAADLIRSELDGAGGSFHWPGAEDPIPFAAYQIGSGFLLR